MPPLARDPHAEIHTARLQGGHNGGQVQHTLLPVLQPPEEPQLQPGTLPARSCGGGIEARRVDAIGEQSKDRRIGPIVAHEIVAQTRAERDDPRQPLASRHCHTIALIEGVGTARHDANPFGQMREGRQNAARVDAHDDVDVFSLAPIDKGPRLRFQADGTRREQRTAFIGIGSLPQPRRIAPDADTPQIDAVFAQRRAQIAVKGEGAAVLGDGAEGDADEMSLSAHIGGTSGLTGVMTRFSLHFLRVIVLNTLWQAAMGLIEVQTGGYVGEDDIVRYEGAYQSAVGGGFCC